MKKVLLIGIDSLAPELLVKYAEDLPNFTKLRQESPEIDLKSIFPVDSIPAWMSIYTGLNPAKHGIVYTFDIFDTMSNIVYKLDSSILKGRTFWDYAGDSGKKVCVLFPFLAYPPWAVNGIMVSRSIKEYEVEGEESWVVEREVQTYPAEVMEEYGIPHFMRGVKGRPPGRRNFKRYVEILQEATRKEADLALKISQDYQWDLFLVVFSWLDVLQHFFWRYMDESDPRYPGLTPYKDVIKELYRIFDRIIGDFMESHPDAIAIIFSDHGHGMRPPKTVNINEYLREKGFLFSKATKLNPLAYLVEVAKRKLLDFTQKHELDSWLINLSTTRIFRPVSQKIYMSSSNIDWERTLAYLSAFAGPKSYTHGGIEIKKDNLGDRGIEYEELRDAVIEEISELREPNTGEKLVNWICKREDLYSGQYISLFPDIVFELKEGYGVYWGIHTPLIGTAYEHNLASGGHRKNAVFLISNIEGKEYVREHMSLMDIAPTVLDLLGIKGEFNFDGKSIFKE